MTHVVYVTAAYLVAAAGILGIAGWLYADWTGRKRELEALETQGVRRRSDRR